MEAALSLNQKAGTDTGVAAFSGAAVVSRIRRVLVSSVIAALLYSALMGGSRGYCAGAVDDSSGFVDAAGRAAGEAPRCVELTLGPGPLVYLAIVLVVLVALGRVIRAPNEPAALRILDRSVIGVGVLVLVAIVVSQVWLRMIPLEDFTAGSVSVFSPFPFGFIDVANTPMPVR